MPRRKLTEEQKRHRLALDLLTERGVFAEKRPRTKGDGWHQILNKSAKNYVSSQQLRVESTKAMLAMLEKHGVITFGGK